MTSTPIDAFIYDGIRSPFGRDAGALASVRPDDLMAHAIRTLVARGTFRGDDVEDVVVGGVGARKQVFVAALVIVTAEGA